MEDVLRQRLKRKARNTRFGVGGLAVKSVCAAQMIADVKLSGVFGLSAFTQ